MRREEGGDGIELGLHRRGAGAAGGNAAGDAGLEQDLGAFKVKDSKPETK